MRRFNTIIESANPPGRNQLWIDHKKLRYFAEDRWELLGGGEINPPEISDHDTWIIEGVDTGKPSKGDTGPKGAKGEDGTNGITPHIGTNSNWFLGESDTGVLARGTNGRDGVDGRNGVNGINGEDGASSRVVLAFRYNLTNPGIPVGGSWNPLTNEVTYPEGWGEEIPVNVTPIWMTTTIFSSKEPTQSIGWSTPVKITGLDGKDGTNGTNGSDGTTGNSIRVLYCKTSSPNVTPVVISDNINPGSIWGTSIPNRTYSEAIWGIQATVTYDNKLVDSWEGPYLLTGINGTDGTDGKDAVTPNWYTYVFKLSDDRPSGPTSNDPNNPGNGWLDYPNANGNWWQCIGTVNGVTGKVTEWSEVIPLNGRDGQDGQDGQDGTAQDGRYTEFRFAKTTGSTPSLNKTLRDPSGWTVDFPTISEGEILWMIKAVINPDDTLYTNWDGPIRISGERGPQGNTGPAGKDGATGSQGIAGIPGVDIEWRFSLGTESSYDATYNSAVKATRDPSSYGWSLTQPNITEAKPYIWLIQARIIHTVNTDEGHLDDNGWQTPIRLNGVNGLDGANGPAGKKGQLIYPAGVYGNTISYTTDDYKAPYVLDPSDGNFYVLNSIMTWVGTQQNNKTPSQSYQEDGSKYWLKFEAFEAIYAKIGVIANGLIGSAVFNGNYMFSQQGTDADGNPSSDYDEFTGGEDSPFKPNLLIDFNTGDITYKGISQVLSYQMKDNENLVVSKAFPYNRIVAASNCTITFALHPDPSIGYREIEVKGAVTYNYKITGMLVNRVELEDYLEYVNIVFDSKIQFKTNNRINVAVDRYDFGNYAVVGSSMAAVITGSTIFGDANIGTLIYSTDGYEGTFYPDEGERRVLYPFKTQTISVIPVRLSAFSNDYVNNQWWTFQACIYRGGDSTDGYPILTFKVPSSASSLPAGSAFMGIGTLITQNI